VKSHDNTIREDPIKYILTLIERPVLNKGSAGDGTETRGWQFAGAIYNMLSRGNYRKELFDHGGARLFEKTLLMP
jgi:hypothetical protein